MTNERARKMWLTQHTASESGASAGVEGRSGGEGKTYSIVEVVEEDDEDDDEDEDEEEEGYGELGFGS